MVKTSDARVQTPASRQEVAAAVDDEPSVRSRGRSAAAQVLLPGDVCLPLRSRARRPRPELHHRRHHGADEAYARIQRAASVRLGCVRTARRERGDQDRRAPRNVDARQHRPHERAVAAVGHQLRLGSRNRDLHARLLQIQPVDLPEDVRARPCVPQALERQLVSELPDGSRQRAGHRRDLLAVRLARRDP